MAKSRINIVFGSMTIGKKGLEGARVHTKEDTMAMLDVFQKHGHNELDTARVYTAGTCEEMLAEAGWEKRGIKMETKLYPTKGKPMSWITPEEYTLSASDVRTGLMRSLKALGSNKIEMFYLHGPDRNTPLEITLGEVDKLYKEGHFNRFGISNFMSWEVASICEICEKNGWIKPTAYQGIYNTLHRATEPELFPCLRHYGIAMYSFQPLAGGFLTGRYRRDTEEYEAGSRFDPERNQGKLHHGRYMNDAHFEALDIIQPVAEKYSLTDAEVALRWISHHSMLSAEKGDTIIIGASSVKHLEENLVDLEKGPLPEEVVQALDAGWQRVKGQVFKYWH